MNETIKITMTLLDARELHRILADLRKIEMNAAGSFKIVKLLALLDPYSLEAEKKRAFLIKEKWGVITPDNKGYNVPEEKMPEFTAELSEQLSEKVEVECPTFSQSDFDGAKIAPEFFMAIAPLLK